MIEGMIVDIVHVPGVVVAVQLLHMHVAVRMLMDNYCHCLVLVGTVDMFGVVGVAAQQQWMQEDIDAVAVAVAAVAEADVAVHRTTW